MPTNLKEKQLKKGRIEQLQVKAALFDEILEFIEDKYLGHLMKSTEKERNLPLAKAKKILH